MDTTIKTEYVEYTIKNGIIIASYTPQVHIDFKAACRIVEDRLAFTGNVLYPVLINSQGVVKMDKDARDYLSSPEGVRGLKAAAILVNSPFSSFLGNFFVWVNRTELPVKIFSRYEPAITWLERYR